MYKRQARRFSLGPWVYFAAIVLGLGAAACTFAEFVKMFRRKNGKMCIRDSNVTTSLSYPVKEIFVQVGDTGSEGDVICTLDSSDLEEQLSLIHI